MTFDVSLTITGLQEAQEANLKLIAALQPTGALNRVIIWATTETHRRLTPNTPHDTGALRASRRVEVQGLEGRVFDDPAAANPRSRTPPSRYDVYLHAMGEVPGLRSGIRASMPYTVRTAGPSITQRAGKMLLRQLPQ